MSLPVPVVGQETGPQYAVDVNTCFTILDSHTHANGSGVQITPAAININAALTFANNPATNLSSAGFATQSADVSTAGYMYVKLGAEGTPRPDLFYYDGVTAVQITAGGNVNATAANIPGESYAGGTFTWRQGTGSTVPANFDIGSAVLRPNTAGTTNGITLDASSVAAAYNWTFPAGLPGSQSFLTINSSGAVAAPIPFTAGITTSNISASANITGSQLSASANIAGSQLSSSAGIVFGQIATTTLDGGTYTPTTSNTANITTLTPAVFQWMRVKNTVTASGNMNIQTTTGGAFSFTMSLPAVSNNFASLTQAGGSCMGSLFLSGAVGYFNAIIGTGTVTFIGSSASNGLQVASFMITYQVI